MHYPNIFSLIVASVCTATFSLPATAEQVIMDNLVVSGDVCLGPNCVSGDPTQIDGVKVKSDSPQILFDDDGNAQSREWSVSAWASESAGQFVVRDWSSSGAYGVPFVINKGAGSSALNVSSNGYIGFGTSMPQRELHVINPSAPALRLEQDTTLGFESHTWDVSASNSGFQIIDVASPFSVIPFAIENGAEPGSLHVDSDGNVGLRTTNPTAPLHVLRADGSARILVEETGGGGAQELFQMKSNGGSYFTVSNTTSGRDWFFTHENAAQGRFIITSSTNPADGLFLAPGGDMKIGGTLTTGGGTCGGGCDAVFSDEYDLPSIAEHADAMWSLGHLPNVGQTLENQPINVSDKLGRMLNELEHAHIYIDQLHGQLTEQDVVNQNLMARLEQLEQVVSQ